jgi:predicted nucleotidyltransferase component of viral defense system
MISSNEISRISGAERIDPMLVERDYVLGCFVSFLATDPRVNKNWIFKGGTALRKCHFTDYRFSEDVDFTITAIYPVNVMQSLIKDVNAVMHDVIGIVTNERDVSVETIKDDYGAESYEIKFYYRGPWIFRGVAPAVKIHLSRDEKMVFSPKRLPVIHQYSDRSELPPVLIPVYSLDEILVEKLQAFSGQRRHVVSRDIYDIHQITQQVKYSVQLRNAFEEKCTNKGIQLNEINLDRIKKQKQDYEINWKNNLEYLVPVSMRTNFEDAWDITMELLGKVLTSKSLS